MSAAEIMAELPRMTVQERREIARRLFDLEADAEALRTRTKRRIKRSKFSSRWKAMAQPNGGDVWIVDLGLAEGHGDRFAPLADRGVAHATIRIVTCSV